MSDKIETMEQFWAAAERLDPDGWAKSKAAQAEMAEMRKDAERYRKVRRGQHWSVINGIGDTLRGDALDSAVDAQG